MSTLEGKPTDDRYSLLVCAAQAGWISHLAARVLFAYDVARWGARVLRLALPADLVARPRAEPPPSSRGRPCKADFLAALRQTEIACAICECETLV